MVYRSDEKEKAVPLISRLLHYVFPYLRNHRYGYRRLSVTPQTCPLLPRCGKMANGKRIQQGSYHGL